ncbi:MAG: LytTR family DNA-binding domain-containing protein, partial [Phenylobacterium sp.]
DGAGAARGRPLVIGLIGSTACGLILGVLGPFGSYLNGPLVGRIGYWLVCVWVGSLTFGAGLTLLARQARARRLPTWLWTPPAVALLTLAPAGVSRLLALRLWPVVAQVSALEWYAQCLAISVVATVIILWADRRRRASVAGPDPTAADPRDRLPPRLGREVTCLQVEDHYVRVHTPLGSALVLMSLSQAMAGLSGLEGVQTHRSWWVARGAILGVVEDGRNLRLRLTGGLEAPVSRSRVGLLREDGWLAPGRTG